MDLETLKGHQHLVMKGPTVCFDEASSLTRDEKKLLHLLLEMNGDRSRREFQLIMLTLVLSSSFRAMARSDG